MNRSVLRGILLIAIAAAVLIALVAMPRHPGKKQHPPNDDPWVLVNYNPDDPYGTYLGNGFISTRIMGDGVGSQNGKPLSCYMAGLYDNEKLIPIPTWSDLRFFDGKTQFKIDKTADYKQTLDMRTGIFTTYATWRAGRKALKGKIEVIVSRAELNVGLVRAELTPDFAGFVSVHTGLAKPGPALRFVTGSIAKMSGGAGERILSVYICKQSGLVLVSAATFDARLRAREGVKAVVSSCVSIAAGHSVDVTMHSASSHLSATIGDRDAAIARHKSAWAKLWQSDIAIDGPRKDQQVIHSCEFYLLQSVREGARWSIPPMGLSNNAFSGHVFWDADIWMFPGLILQHPELAKSIVEYRYQTLPGAIANAKAAGMPGAQYAWESGSTGKEDVPKDLVYKHERHINGDVALAQWQYYLATNDLNWLRTRGYPVIKATADWWTAKAKWVHAKKRYEILQVVPPDESAELVNNSAYTNAIAKMNLQIAARAAALTGQRPNPRWGEVASKLYIPFDPKTRRFIAFDGYGSGRFGPRYKAKQADTELLIHPLQFQIPSQSMTDIYKNTFQFYAPRVDSHGPAMTSSAHAVIAARLGDCSRAYADFKKSYEPYLRGPFNYFNEKPSKFIDNMCFLTGAAGPVQGALFGLAGIGMDYFGMDVSGFGSAQQPGIVEKPKSRNTDLAFHPCLPKEWKSLKITNIHWRGKTFDLTVTPGNKVTVQQKSRG